MPAARGAVTANFINGNFVCGRRSQLYRKINKYFSLSSYFKQLDRKRSHANSMRAPDIFSCNGKLYAIGGRSNGMSFNVDANEVYDPGTNK